MKKIACSLVMISVASFSNLGSAIQLESGDFEAIRGVGLNQFCDPIGTIYSEGAPETDENLEIEYYLADKGLNVLCDAIDTVYETNPLGNSCAGATISADEYRSQKQWVWGLNYLCDAADTMYIGGSPLFNMFTGEMTSAEDYRAAKGLNQYCDPIGTMYMGGNPLFNMFTGEMLSLEEYLSQKFLILN